MPEPYRDLASFVEDWKRATLLAHCPPLCVFCGNHYAVTPRGECKRCATGKDD